MHYTKVAYNILVKPVEQISYFKLSRSGFAFVWGGNVMKPQEQQAEGSTHTHLSWPSSGIVTI